MGFERSVFGRLAYYLDSKFNIRSVILFFIFCLSLSAVMFYDLEMIGDYSVGEIAPADIKSPMNIVIVDEVATEEKRNEAEATLPIILDYEDNVYGPMYDAIYRSFHTMRNMVRQINWPKSDLLREEAVKEFVRNKPALSLKS